MAKSAQLEHSMRVIKYVYKRTKEFSFNALCIYTLLLIILFLGCTTAIIENVKETDPVALLNKGIAANVKGQYDRAITYFNKAIEIDPKFAEAYNNRGKSFYYKEHYDQTISDCNKALELNPGLAEAYSSRGYAYMRKEKYDHAIADFSRSIKINPWEAKAYYNRGWAYYKKSQYEKAIADFSRSIELNPSDADAYYQRGYAYMRKEKYDHAIADFSRSIELNPSDADAYHQRGVSHAGKGELDQAISDFTKTLKLNPRHEYVHHNRAVIYVNKRQYLKACADWKQRCELFGWCDNYESTKKKYVCEIGGELGTKTNPVKGYMPSGEREYIMRLRCPRGDEPEFKRIGSYGIGPYGNMLDGYTLNCKKDNIEKFIYMDMYHRGYRETKPVPGFTVMSELPALIAKGCPPEVPGYKPGTYIFRLFEVKCPPYPKSGVKDSVDIGKKGRVNVEVVVDENGRVVTDKVKFHYWTDLSLREHAIGYLSGIVFEPAEHHPNCKVPVKLKLSITFE
jgi:tetratricopeptide (TPR) repeat protein